MLRAYGQSQLSHAQETKECLLDGSVDTKWLDFGAGGGRGKSWFAVALHSHVALEFYGLSSANDEPGRDPCTWSLLGLPADGEGDAWVQLDRRVDIPFPSRKATLTYWVRALWVQALTP